MTEVSPKAASPMDAASADAPQKARLPAVESCREWVAAKHDRCNERAVLILWGKLLPPEALGPRCYDHAYDHLGTFAMSNIDQWAVYDLRPVNALHAEGASDD